MSRGRDWAWRALLSALAGGGITAAGIGGPLAGGALGAEAPAPGSQQAGSGAREQSAEQTTSTTTTTTTAAPAPTPTPTSTAPSTTSAPAPPASRAPEPVPGKSSEQPRSSNRSPAPAGTGQRRQPSTTTGHAKHAHTPPAGHRPASTGGTSSPPLAPAPQVLQPGAIANIAPAPQLAASQGVVPSPLLSGSLAAAQALGFYRVPLFLLPIYQAASAQYGVPWQVLAAINEVETDYGNDLSVSSAGAVGWMQFMPETWLQYGVDALNAGYADPYNPVDAIFAAARYLHAAGASSNLSAAILAYNHSEAYVQSVLLRARLIASYPPAVIATLTGLTEGSLPVAGGKLLPGPQTAGGAAGASPTQAGGAGAGATGVAPSPSVASSSLPGSTPAPAPALSGASAQKLADAPAPLSQLSELSGPQGAPVLAVEDGRIVALGRSRKLGDYIVLRDTYGDVFTYASLGSIAPSYRLSKPASLEVPKGALRSAHGGSEPAPTQPAAAGSQQPAVAGSQQPATAGSQQPAVAGSQQPVTLHVASKQAPNPAGAGGSSVAPLDSGAGKVRVFAHPGNADALAAARAQAARSKAVPAGSSALERGSLVAQGTVLGRLAANGQSPRSVLRFAIRPPGAQTAIEPGPVLQNWAQLDAALHPQGAKAVNVLAGATASDAFLMSGAELERAVLADPEIRLGACDRQQVASGRVDERMLALLVFLSRSGLKPTVGQLRCGHAAYANGRPLVAYLPGDTLTISAINGVPIAGHQGAGTITDVTIRTLLTAKRPFAPKRIVSLMQYPGVPNTLAKPDHAALIEVQLAARPRQAVRAHAASRPAPSAAGAAGLLLGSAQWNQLIARIGGLAEPKLSRKPSSAAIRDPRS